MSHVLLPHQIRHSDFLVDRKKGGDFSGMGSGKTLTAIAALKKVQPPGTRTNRAVVIGPPISLHMWIDELEEAGYNVQHIKTARTMYDPRTAEVYVMSYQIATSQVGALLKAGVTVMICDEAHALKDIKAKRTQAMLGKHGLCSRVQYAWFLTGTPSTRWNDDLYPLLCNLDMAGVKEHCGGISIDKFRLRYCYTQQRKFSPYQKVPTILTVGNKNTEELNHWLYDADNPLAMRAELKDVWKDMPDLTVTPLYIGLKGLTAEDKQMLKSLEKKSASEIERDLRSKEPQLATIRRTIGLAKVPDALEYIKERLENEDRGLLIGAWHTDVIDLLFTDLIKMRVKVAIVDGRTSMKNKRAIQNDFNEGRVRVIVGQIAAMGVSLNLQHGGNNIITVEEDWSPDVMDQFYARLRRMGQTRAVHASALRADNVIDKAVSRISSVKRREHVKLNQQQEA